MYIIFILALYQPTQLNGTTLSLKNAPCSSDTAGVRVAILSWRPVPVPRMAKLPPWGMVLLQDVAGSAHFLRSWMVLGWRGNKYLDHGRILNPPLTANHPVISGVAAVPQLPYWDVRFVIVIHYWLLSLEKHNTRGRVLSAVITRRMQIVVWSWQLFWCLHFVSCCISWNVKRWSLCPSLATWEGLRKSLKSGLPIYLVAGYVWLVWLAGSFRQRHSLFDQNQVKPRVADHGEPCGTGWGNFVAICHFFGAFFRPVREVIICPAARLVPIKGEPLNRYHGAAAQGVLDWLVNVAPVSLGFRSWPTDLVLFELHEQILVGTAVHLICLWPNWVCFLFVTDLFLFCIGATKQFRNLKPIWACSFIPQRWIFPTPKISLLQHLRDRW